MHCSRTAVAPQALLKVVEAWPLGVGCARGLCGPVASDGGEIISSGDSPRMILAVRARRVVPPCGAGACRAPVGVARVRGRSGYGRAGPRVTVSR
jgi:hypothetical protein